MNQQNEDEAFEKVNNIERFTEYVPQSEGNIYAHFRKIFKAGIEYNEKNNEFYAKCIGLTHALDCQVGLNDELKSENKKLASEVEELVKNLEWAVDTAYFWVDNHGDRQRCVDLEYKYKLKIDHSNDDDE